MSPDDLWELIFVGLLLFNGITFEFRSYVRTSWTKALSWKVFVALLWLSRASFLLLTGRMKLHQAATSVNTIIFKPAATLVVLLFIELMSHLSHVKQMCSQPMHEMILCIQITREG